MKSSHRISCRISQILCWACSSLMFSWFLKCHVCADRLCHCLEVTLHSFSPESAPEHGLTMKGKQNAFEYTSSCCSQSFTWVRAFMLPWGHEDLEESAPKKGRDMSFNATLSCLLYKVSNSSSPKPKLCITSDNNDLYYVIFKPGLVQRVQMMTEPFSVMHFGAL